MKEINIKSHSRKGKGGKTVNIPGYTRRVGRKGQHSPPKPRRKRTKETDVTEPPAPRKLPQAIKDRLDKWDSLARRQNNLSVGRSKQLNESKQPQKSYSEIIKRTEVKTKTFMTTFEKKLNRYLKLLR